MAAAVSPVAAQLPAHNSHANPVEFPDNPPQGSGTPLCQAAGGQPGQREPDEAQGTLVQYGNQMRAGPDLRGAQARLQPPLKVKTRRGMRVTDLAMRLLDSRELLRCVQAQLAALCQDMVQFTAAVLHRAPLCNRNLHAARRSRASMRGCRLTIGCQSASSSGYRSKRNMVRSGQKAIRTALV